MTLNHSHFAHLLLVLLKFCVPNRSPMMKMAWAKRNGLQLMHPTMAEEELGESKEWR